VLDRRRPGLALVDSIHSEPPRSASVVPTATQSPMPTQQRRPLCAAPAGSPAQPAHGGRWQTGDVTLEGAAELYASLASELNEWKQAGVKRVAINAWQHVGDSVLIEIRQFRSPVALLRVRAVIPGESQQSFVEIGSSRASRSE
jgi:hypothetical protein